MEGRSCDRLSAYESDSGGIPTDTIFPQLPGLRRTLQRPDPDRHPPRAPGRLPALRPEEFLRQPPRPVGTPGRSGTAGLVRAARPGTGRVHAAGFVPAPTAVGSHRTSAGQNDRPAGGTSADRPAFGRTATTGRRSLQHATAHQLPYGNEPGLCRPAIARNGTPRRKTQHRANRTWAEDPDAAARQPAGLA